MDNRESIDLMMVQHPELWPKWPILPLIEVDNIRRAGVLIDNGRPVVYLANMFTLASGTLHDVFKDIPTQEYDSFEDLVKDWRVD